MDNKDITIEISNIENYTIELNEQGPQGLMGPQGQVGPQGQQGIQGPAGQDGEDGQDGADATINGYNTFILTASNGLTLTQSGGTADISGATLESDISDIEDLIPSQATSSNQLADKDFVNSSIATNTANFIGTFNSLAELEAYSGTLTNNDYAFVVVTDQYGNTAYDRYKYTTATTPASWQFEYELNNSSFTAEQWAAINSGITSSGVSLISTALQPNDNITELTNNAGYTTNIGTVTSVNNIQPDANGNVTLSIPGAPAWGDITGTLSNQTDLNSALNSKQDTLVSGTNIKTINNSSILGSGNLTIDALPSQTSQSGKFLTTDGTTASWGVATKVTIRTWS